MKIRRSTARGTTNLEWLHSRHTFSFGQYYDPRHMGVSVLRVLNDDQVAPGGGFAPHAHRDMEIISYVTSGVIEHQDSMGNVQRLPAGEFQLMSAGTGVVHSEYNASPTDPLHFLQIWIVPERQGIAPGYQQKRFAPATGLQLIASPDARNGSLLLHQDACLYHLVFDTESHVAPAVRPGRMLYLHVLRGAISVGNETLQPGDGGAIRDVDAVQFSGKPDTEALLFDLP